jgi:hypothetical protein
LDEARKLAKREEGLSASTSFWLGAYGEFLMLRMELHRQGLKAPRVRK